MALCRPDAQPPRCPQPVWDGSPLAGRTIVLLAEQGLGDTLQFVRYVRLVKQRGGKSCSYAPAPGLAAEHAGIDQICVDTEPAPQFDVYASLMSLPKILRTDENSIPATVPYLSAAEYLVERCAVRWTPTIVACEWVSPGKETLPIKETDTGRFRWPASRRWPTSPCASVEPAKRDWQRTIGRRPFRRRGSGHPAGSSHLAFCDTAAVIMNLDLVIMSDTAIAHLAGALGCPVWTALSLSPDWRWMLNRADSPWYPTMRLFRQSRLADWSEVFERIAAELSALVSTAVRGRKSTSNTRRARPRRNSSWRQRELLNLALAATPGIL